MLLVLVCISLVEIVAGLTNQINTDCDRHPIGLQNRSIVPNSSFTASSYFDARYKPSDGRLNSTHGWAPRTKNDTQDYLQIDLGKKSLVCAVATQGNGYVYESEWVTHYKLNYSMDGVVWNTYRENEEDKIFQGNTDQFTVVKQYLQNSQPTRYIRFIPTRFNSHKTIRVEVYASDLGQMELHVTPHQRSLQLTWGIMKGQVRSYMIEFDNKSRIESFTLPNTTQGYNLTNLRPYTEYSVRIKAIPTNNGVGLWSNWIYVKTSISEPKARPYNVSLTPMSSKEIKVTWKLGGIELLNGPLAGYRIAYTDEKRNTKKIDVGNTSSYTLNSLEATTEYNITVAVNNTKYIGPSSDVVRATTYRDAPTCSPKITSAEAVSSTSIHVTWEPPPEGKCRNGVLQGYTVSRYLTDRGGLKYERTNDPKVTNWTLTGLEKYSQYTINVRAYTIIDGPPDTIGAKTAEDGPNCYSHIKSVLPVNSTSIRVEWSPLSNQPCLNGILRGYKIAYRRFDNLSLHFVNISNPNTTTKVLTGLRKYTKYYIHVLGYTVKNGVLSNASVGRTLEDVPDCSPTITNIQAASSTSIRLAWQQDSTCLNGILRGYIIEYSLLGNSTVQSINITDDRLSGNKTVTGLGKYTSYRFRMLAYTIGEGPMSNVSVTRTGEDAPTCSPKLLSAQTLSSSSVRLTWTPPDNTECRNGILRGYRIKCNLLEGSKIENFTVSDPNATTHVVGGLHSYTWYKFWVLAYTVADGPWSNMLSNRTGEDAPSCAPDIKSVLAVNSTSIHVEWSPLVTNSCLNGILRGYKIAYKKYDGDKHHFLDIKNLNTTARIVSGLRKYSNYSFQVLAYTIKDGNLSKALFGVTHEDVPDCSPVIINIQAASSTSIRLAWQQDSTCLNGILRGYIIEYSLLGNSTVQSINITDDRLSSNKTVTGLGKYTSYMFRMLAYTIGEGPMSNVSVTRTGEDAPTCSPKLLSAQSTSSISVRLTWSPPPNNQCRNGILRGYRIGYSPRKEISEPTLDKNIEDPNATAHEINGLHHYTWYTFWVLAYTVADGPWSNTVFNRTGEDAPSCAPDIKSVLAVNSTSIHVEWSPLVTNSCLNGILRGYKIAYKKYDGDKHHFLDIKNLNTTARIVSGLRKYSNYSFQVLAYTIKDGNLSKALFGVTHEDVPDCSPVIINIQAASSTSIRLAWQQDSTCLNGILRGYIIEYSLLGNSTVQSINITDDRLSSNKTVTGLGKYTSYRFRILAYTIGEGPMSNVSVTRTGEDAPTCSPKLLSAQTHSSSSVRLTWTPPDNTECRNGILRGYRIKCNLLEGSKIENFTVSDPNATTHVVGGLHPYTWYKFWVLAYTVADGPWSNMLSNRTGEDAPTCSPKLLSAQTLSSSSVRLTWTPPDNTECRNGILRGYRIKCNLLEGSKKENFTVSDPNATTHVVGGLHPYTWYKFWILAYTVADGPWSNMLSNRTGEDAPKCSPTLVSVRNVSSTCISVTWTPLATRECRNGIIRGYKIYYTNIRTLERLVIKIIDNDTTTAVNVTGLSKYTEYSFRILAYTVEDGPPSNEITQRTSEDAPSPPVNVNRTLLHANGSVGPRVEVRWDEPHAKNGVIQKYTLVYLYNHDKYTEKKVVMPLKGQRIHVHTINVMGEATFSFKIKAHTIKDGSYQHGEDLIVPPYPPSTAPTNISTRKINDTSFLMQWSPIPRHKSNGNITKYEVSWTLSSRIRALRVKRYLDEKIKSDSTEELQYMINGLLSCAQYSIRVRAYTRVGPGPHSTPIKINTSKPESPYGVLAKTTNATSVLLLWRKPANVIERINKYTIEYKGHKTYTERYKTTGNVTVQDGRTALWITNLLPATHYEFWVSAFTACGRSPKSNSTKTKTSITNPLAPNITTVQQYHDTGVKVNVTLFPSLQINGPISAYQVIVQFRRTGNSLVRLPSNYRNSLYDYPVAAAKNLDYYVTAELPSDWLSSSKKLVIGDNTTHKNYRNVPLEKGSRYHIYQRAVTDDKGRLMYSKEVLVANVTVAAEVKEETKARIQDSPGSETLVGGIIGLMLLLILVVVVGYIIWRRHRNAQKKDIQMISVPVKVLTPPEQQRSTNYQDQKNEEILKPIHVTKFAEYIATVRRDDFSQLINQYKLIPGIHNFSCIAAKKPVNKFKNRYGNIVPYDHSRVTLQHIKEQEESDYINACFIHGYDGSQKTYIACQGPLPETINDFWRMIWEQNTSSIVMLTNLMELGKRKCHQYWPEDSEQYADIKIKNHKTEVYADYIIRTFLLSKGTNEKISRRVRLFHFIAWPDKGVPKNATALLSFRRKVRELTKWNTGPTVIHCSAGVGRTGTYMVIDAMLEQVENKETIDIFNYLKVLRKDRSYMVQTFEQYVFIHMAIFEEITCGNSEIQTNDLEIAMQNLAAIDDEQNLTGYAMEFLRLEFVASYGLSEECDVGQDEENQQKNRYQNIVAMDRFRVVLSTDDSNQGDYINASFIDTYRERNAFIMTQAPMENTIVDFWRMVMDYEIGTIVMLNNLQEGDETFPEYWPEGGIVLYNGIEIKLLKTEQYADIISRQIQISYQSVNHNVQHLQYTAWENHSVPNDVKTCLDLVQKVCKSQQKCDSNPVVVHCSNGVGRSGTFCAIASCLERVKQEQVLDVFQTVKSIRVNRPGAVETLIQYVFCYQIIQEYLDSFSDYDNFNG